MQGARAPYGRHSGHNSREPETRSTHDGASYYDLPAIKASHYGHLVASYFFAGGLAGAAQMLAALEDLRNRGQTTSIVRTGRYLGLAGAALSPIFLTADLQTPGRWYNMLRIWRPTSAMSMGSWTLTVFGGASGVTAAAQLLADRTHSPLYLRAARFSGIASGAIGAVVAAYPGALLASTSTPLWSRPDLLLPALFGLSATATALAGLSLGAEFQGAPLAAKRRLEAMTAAAAGAEALVTAALDRRLRRDGLAAPLHEPPLGLAYRLGYKALGLAAPFAIHLVGLVSKKHSPRWSIAAAAATLIGGYVLRSVIVFAGNRSAHRPQDYFRITQPPEPAAARPGERRSLEALCRTTIEKLEHALKLPGQELMREIDDVENRVVALRDAFIEALRREPESPQASHHRRALQQVNVALSLVVEIEYPITRIPRQSLQTARDTLAELLAGDLPPQASEKPGALGTE